jgi:hypothetical protein
MQLDSYVHEVQAQLVAAGALGDDRVREVAATLAGAASPAIRLALLKALAAAADEVTAALLDSPGAPAVTVRLDADEIRVVVSSSGVVPVAVRPDDTDASARISLRLSESLKAEIDAAATQTGVSVNTWLVRAAVASLGAPSSDLQLDATGRNRRAANAHHVTGWING